MSGAWQWSRPQPPQHWGSLGPSKTSLAQMGATWASFQTGRYLWYQGQLVKKSWWHFPSRDLELLNRRSKQLGQVGKAHGPPLHWGWWPTLAKDQSFWYRLGIHLFCAPTKCSPLLSPTL